MHIALLRGINVGGPSQVAMSDLRGLFAEFGFADVKSLLQSGNVVFQSNGAIRSPGSPVKVLRRQTH